MLDGYTVEAREFVDDECQDSAAALTYYGVLAIFPGLLALTSLLALVGQGGSAIDQLLGVLEGVKLDHYYDYT